MRETAILFDLDGTLTDSGEGILNCAELALRHFGLTVPDRTAMRVFVGPPLQDTFVKFGVAPEDAEEAVRVFRSRYLTVGKFENRVYDGIPETLEALRKAGFRLFVATSKPEATAIEILEKFGLSPYFEKICGATFDGTRDAKEAVIAYLKSLVSDLQNVIMVGDTAYDVLGAAAHNIPTIGVTWGYGKAEDMEKAGAVAIAHTPEALTSLLLNFHT